MNQPCRICGDSQHQTRLKLREMQLGLREEFWYFQCHSCGSVQIEEVPGDLGRFYPTTYYSLAMDLDRPASLLARAFFRTVRTLAPLVRMVLLDRSPLGRWPRHILSRLDLRLSLLDVMSQTGITPASAILDVGSGQGFIPFCLAQIGFRQVLGIDPFLAQERQYANGFRVQKTDLLELSRTTQQRFDLIVFHHSLEHMEHQAAALRAAGHLLADNGLILVRMPVVDCDAFAKYRENFVSLDAPRHLVIHTRRSTALLAGQAGLMVEKVIYDSNESQFWASEQYLRDIPLVSPRSYWHHKRESIFTRQQIRQFRNMARALNAAERGDWAAFFLRKPACPQETAGLTSQSVSARPAAARTVTDGSVSVSEQGQTT